MYRHLAGSVMSRLEGQVRYSPPSRSSRMDGMEGLSDGQRGMREAVRTLSTSAVPPPRLSAKIKDGKFLAGTVKIRARKGRDRSSSSLAGSDCWRALSAKKAISCGHCIDPETDVCCEITPLPIDQLER